MKRGEVTHQPLAPLLVGLAGGSGSGKSSLASALVTALAPQPVTRLCHDAYYRDRSALPPAERASVNYDVPDAFDQELFLAHLAALRAGVAVRPPRYCFATHCRLGEDARVAAAAVVVVEGILLLWDPRVRAALDLSIFLDAPEAVRFERRLARDVAERGRTPASVLTQLEATVRDAHATYVEPTRALADLVLTSLGGLSPLAEIAAALVLDRLARRALARAGAA
ncbi:MAG TPA: uridine kinase [Methylomirabilota bacterium]|nr:uridine kinase [Methylomirabilota bacterium]